MTSHRAFALAMVLTLAGTLPVQAQFPPPPGQAGANPFPPPPGQSGGASPFPPAPGQSGPPVSAAPRGGSPFPAPGQQPAQANQCQQFVPLRQAAEKGAAAIRAASERKAAREEVCPLFKNFAAAESRMVKFLADNQRQCNVPADAVKQARTSHARTIQIRNQVCSVAAAPRGPSLSDAFSGPLIPTEPPKPGRGTFDTLTGNVLDR